MPMPKRKLTKTPVEALEAIKQARKRGIPITEEEARQIQRSVSRPPSAVMPTGSIAGKGKDGEPRYWSPGQRKGPGLLEPPLSRKLHEMERDYQTLVTKLRRRPPVEAATKARIERSKRAAIEQAWRAAGLASRNAANRIAKQYQVSPAYVRKVRAQMRLTESQG